MLKVYRLHRVHVMVSMKSGLEDRNNREELERVRLANENVSMKSGLEDRNNKSVNVR